MSEPTHDPVLLIVWHSQTGACEQAARALAAGGADAGAHTRIRCLHADQTAAVDILQSTTLVIVAAENLGALSGRIKDVFDRSYYALLDRVAGRAFASVICAGSDGAGAESQLERIATGLRLHRVAPPLRLLMHAQTPEAILAPKRLSDDQYAQCYELGRLLALRIDLGI